MCAHATQILAAVSFRQWRLFCSARLKARRQKNAQLSIGLYAFVLLV